MKDPMKTIAVINNPAMLKKLCNIEKLNKESDRGVMPQALMINMIAESACRIIEELTKIYYLVVIPQAVIDEIHYATTESTRQIFKKVLSTRKNIIISDKPCDDIFDFADNVYEEFGCSVDIIPYDIVLIKGEE